MAKPYPTLVGNAFEPLFQHQMLLKFDESPPSVVADPEGDLRALREAAPDSYDETLQLLTNTASVAVDAFWNYLVDNMTPKEKEIFVSSKGAVTSRLIGVAPGGTIGNPLGDIHARFQDKHFIIELKWQMTEAEHKTVSAVRWFTSLSDAKLFGEAEVARRTKTGGIVGARTNTPRMAPSGEFHQYMLRSDPPNTRPTYWTYANKKGSWDENVPHKLLKTFLSAEKGLSTGTEVFNYLIQKGMAEQQFRNQENLAPEIKVEKLVVHGNKMGVQLSGMEEMIQRISDQKTMRLDTASNLFVFEATQTNGTKVPIAKFGVTGFSRTSINRSISFSMQVISQIFTGHLPTRFTPKFSMKAAN